MGADFVSVSGSVLSQRQDLLLLLLLLALNQGRSQNQPTRYYDQAPAMNCQLGSVSDIGRVGSRRYIQTHNFEFWTAERTDSAAATAKRVSEGVVLEAVVKLHGAICSLKLQIGATYIICTFMYLCINST